MEKLYLDNNLQEKLREHSIDLFTLKHSIKLFMHCYINNFYLDNKSEIISFGRLIEDFILNINFR